MGLGGVGGSQPAPGQSSQAQKAETPSWGYAQKALPGFPAGGGEWEGAQGRGRCRCYSPLSV